MNSTFIVSPSEWGYQNNFLVLKTNTFLKFCIHKQNLVPFIMKQASVSSLIKCLRREYWSNERNTKVMKEILQDEFRVMSMDLSYRYFTDQRIRGQLFNLFQHNLDVFSWKTNYIL